MRKTALVLLMVAGLCLAVTAPVTAQSPGPADPASLVKSGYAPVDGLQVYYEIHGSGKPLFLLHGGLGSIEMFGPVLATLAQSHEVIAVDLQGHGRTADIDRPIRYELMADDIAGLAAYLGIPKADVMGYSLGAGVAIQTAVRHPAVVRKLVVVSGTFRRDGWYPEILAGEAQMNGAAAEPMKQTPLYATYAALNPRPQDWPVFLTKLSDLLSRDYDWTAGVKTIRSPTLLVFADQDAVKLPSMVDFFALFGGGQHAPSFDGSGQPTARLAILPGVTHYDIFMSPALASTVIPFLDSDR